MDSFLPNPCKVCKDLEITEKGIYPDCDSQEKALSLKKEYSYAKDWRQDARL